MSLEILFLWNTIFILNTWNVSSFLMRETMFDYEKYGFKEAIVVCTETIWSQ
jgi:hypothetical protein